MITHAGIRICCIDDLPIDRSEAYKVMVKEMGEERANRWTYWKDVPLPPKERAEASG